MSARACERGCGLNVLKLTNRARHWQGTVDCTDTSGQWDETEMCIFVERWVDQAVNEYHIPVHVLAQRAQVSQAEMWAWHQHVTDTVGKGRVQGGSGGKGDVENGVVPSPLSPVTLKIYQFLLRDMSCEVCSGRLCRCCFSFCGICEQLHCKTCSADCVRCEDCLAFFDTGDWCAECGDDFCGCARDALQCDNCRESLCSKCASIFPCFNCRKGYCLIKSETDDEITGCAIRHLWMCPDCRSVGYCKSPPQDHVAVPGGQSHVHGSCMEYGSIECEVCKLRVCLSCANSSATSPSGASSCPRCGEQRSARLKQVLKLRLKRIEDGCRCKQCKLKKLEKKGGGAKNKRISASEDTRAAADAGGWKPPGEGGGGEDRSEKSKAADAKAKADAAAKAFKELMQMEEKEVEKKKEEEPILGPMLNVRVLSKAGFVAKECPGGKAAVFTGSIEFGWSEGKGARRVQVRLDGNEQRFLKIADSATCVTLPDLVLPVGEHVASLRVARAKGPWCAWSADIKFGLADAQGLAQGASDDSEGEAAAETPPAVSKPPSAAKSAADAGTNSAHKKPQDAQKTASGVAGAAAAAAAQAPGGKDSKQQQAADKSKDKDKDKDKASSSVAGATKAGDEDNSGAATPAPRIAEKTGDAKSGAKVKSGKSGKSGKWQENDEVALMRKDDMKTAAAGAKSSGSAGGDKPSANANGSKAAAGQAQKKELKAASKRDGSTATGGGAGGKAGKAAALFGKESTAALAQQTLRPASPSSESDGGRGGDDEDEDALLRLAALSVSNRPGAVKKKDAARQRGAAPWMGADSGARIRDDVLHAASNQNEHQLSSPAHSTHTSTPHRGAAVSSSDGAHGAHRSSAADGGMLSGSGAGGGSGCGAGGSSGVQKVALEPASEQMAHLAHLHGHIVMSCNIESKERGSIIGVRFPNPPALSPKP